MLYDAEELEEFGHKSPREEFLAYLRSNQVLDALVQAVSAFSDLPPEVDPSALEFLALFFEDGASDVLKSAQLLNQYNNQLEVQQLQKRITSLDNLADVNKSQPGISQGTEGTSSSNLKAGAEPETSETRTALAGQNDPYPCALTPLAPSQMDSVCDMICREILNSVKLQGKTSSSTGPNLETNRNPSEPVLLANPESVPKGSGKKAFVRTRNLWVKKPVVPTVSKRMAQKSEDPPADPKPEAPSMEIPEDLQGSLNLEETPAPTPSPIISRQKLKEKVKRTYVMHERKDVTYAEKFTIGGCRSTAKPKLSSETTPSLVQPEPLIEPVKSDGLQQAPPPSLPPASPKYTRKPSAVLQRPSAIKEVKKPKSATSTATTAPSATKKPSRASASTETLKTSSKTSATTNVVQKRSRWTSNTPTQISSDSVSESKASTRHTNAVKT